MKDDRVNDSTNRTAQSSYTVGEAEVAVEVLAEDGTDAHEKCAGTNADAESLSENELPEVMAQRNHHKAKDNEEGSNSEEVM